MTDQSIKSKLLAQCHAFVEERISRIREAINLAQESANEETKSSVGDKYETGRAMMQLEIENLTGQLQEAQKLQETALHVRSGEVHSVVEQGSLVKTNLGTYYLVISAGKITLEGKDYFAIGANAPIAQAMLNKKAGDKVDFNGRAIEILNIE